MKRACILVLGLILFLSGCGIRDSFSEKRGETGVSRAQGVKGAALCLFGKDMESEGGNPPYSDVKEGDWFFPYIKKMYAEGLLLPSESFQPEKNLTLEECASLISRIEPSYGGKIKLTEENRKSPVSMGAWTDILAEAAGLEKKAFGIFSAEDGFLYTDKGVFASDGFDLSSYADNEISLLVKDGQVLGRDKILSEKAVFPNLYIKAVTGGVSLNLHGAERIFPYAGQVDSSSGTVTVKSGKIEKIVFSKSLFTGTVNKIGESLEIDGKILEITDETAYFLKSGEELKSISKGEVICGDKAEVFSSKDEAQTLVITERASPKTLRILLKNSDYSDYFHENVIVEGEGIVRFGDGEREISQNTDLSEFFGGTSRICVYPAGEKLKIVTLNRASGMPSYRGFFEIEKTEKGYIIINIIPMEDYIAGVVSGEISSDFPLSAAKAQALCARSYAFNTFYENKFAHLGGNLDDSTACQVYNSYPENDLSLRAAKETAGECVVYENRVISANFFSTSCGVTANSGEVWLKSSGKTPPYLSHKKLYAGDFGDLSNEAKARAFFETKEVVCLEADCPWFRWETTLSAEVLAENCAPRAEEIYKENPAYISAENGFDPGTIKNIYVTERGQGGNIIQICIEGSLCTVKVNGEYAVRKVFAPCSAEGEAVILTDNSGTKYKNYPMLPSGFFTYEEAFDEENNLLSLKIYGGGFGHGVGLSQNGAKAMGEKGYSYDKIIEYFYPGAGVGKVFSETGE